MMPLFFLFIKGIIIGIADVIPGISGATAALLLGLYDQLIFSFNKILIHIKNKRWKEIIPYLKLLVPIFIGVAVGIVVFAKAIQFILLWWPQETQLFFIGLIIGSLPALISPVNILPINASKSLGFIIGSLIMILILIWDYHQSPYISYTNVLPIIHLQYVLRLFFIGLIVSIATAIPGISGSLILLLIGEYFNIISILNNWSSYLIHFKIHWLNSLALLSFGLGITIGLIIYTVLINKIMKKYKSELFSFALGLIIFSVIKIWPNTRLNISQTIVLTVATILPLGLSYMSSKNNKTT